MKTIQLEPKYQVLFAVTRQTVGGRILRVDLTFANGNELKSIKVINESLVEVPDEYQGIAIEKVSVPFNQY